MKIFCLSLAILLLAACASSYHAWNGMRGYKEVQLDDNHWRVFYVDLENLPWKQISEKARKRCDELAAGHGAESSTFSITTQDTIKVENSSIQPASSGDSTSLVSSTDKQWLDRRRIEGRCALY